ncbi:hypothetical protein [Alloalcanivorax mobilis]|uniref:hypothetical protein n=1 Tax=Alloalcanivorax mobilis TaxID=2019569 RepID=UPI000B5B4056|nr:hypothetical protein [Alloalcanivorax mobilis]ASK33160.1 hypothetical protein CEK62_01545 [Alcanivorax sp. N3-2A]ASK36978.1 hypothetical protein CEK62_21740 [Alcanivorax sp. N3-2A]|tara:strand:+ start:24120 stop:24314 length:195 start_codon:yes stop_codon:yes gene_type:complete
MSKLAIKGLLAITATLWLAQPLENNRALWGADSRAEQLSDSDENGTSASRWVGRITPDQDDTTG